MKRTFSLLLVFTLLLLTACQTTPATPSGDESVPAPDTPWKQMQALSEELAATYDSIAPILFPEFSASVKEGTGTISMTVSQGEGMEGESTSIRGDLTMKDGISKTEMAYVLDGVSIAIVNWSKDGKEYIQYPDMYPDGVFRAEDMETNYLTPPLDLPGFSDEGDGGISADSFMSVIEEFADPEKNMIVTEKDGNSVFSLVLEGESAAELWAEIDKTMGETLGMVGGDDGLLGELSAGDDGEVNYNKAVLTVTTDGKTFQKFLLEGFDGETLKDSISFDSNAGETSVTCKILRKQDDLTTMEMIITATQDRTTIKGNIPSEGAEMEIDLTVTKEANATIAEGKLTVNMEMEGFSYSLPLNLSMSVTTEGNTTDLVLVMEMSMMGVTARYDVQMSVTEETVDLTFPYDDKILTYDGEEFYEKMEETYPDLFYTSSDLIYYYSEDEEQYMYIEEDGCFVGISVDTVYTKDGNVYTIENFGSYTIEEVDGSYTINGTSCEVIDYEDMLSLYVEDYTCVYLHFYLDGSCSVDLWGDGESNALCATFETGDSLALSWEFSEDYTTVTVLGYTLYLELSGSTEI